MTTWSCVIPGKPKAKNKKRAFKKGKHVKITDDDATKAAEENVRAICTLTRPAELFRGPVVQDVDFCFAIPASRSKDVHHKDGTVTRALQVGDLHAQTPDRGNLLKLLDDALSGVVIGDDAQIADGRVRKIWGERDETRVTVRACDDGRLRR